MVMGESSPALLAVTLAVMLPGCGRDKPIETPALDTKYTMVKNISDHEIAVAGAKDEFIKIGGTALAFCMKYNVESPKDSTLSILRTDAAGNPQRAGRIRIYEAGQGGSPSARQLDDSVNYYHSQLPDCAQD